MQGDKNHLRSKKLKDSVASHLQLQLSLIYMKKLIFCLFLLIINSVSFANHHSEKAHVHGSGELSLAFDGTHGKLQFECPADSTVGFEHKPTTEAQKKQVTETLELIKSQMKNMVVFNSDLKCQFHPSEVKLESDDHSSHSETHAEFDIICEKTPKGSTVSFNFSKSFPKLKKVHVQVLVDDLQKSLVTSQGSISLELK
jgi:hypothetical protein